MNLHLNCITETRLNINTGLDLAIACILDDDCIADAATFEHAITYLTRAESAIAVIKEALQLRQPTKRGWLPRVPS